MMKKNFVARDGWDAAAGLLSRWLGGGQRADLLLAGVSGELPGVERGRCQFLFYGALRHLGRVERAMGMFVKHAPRAEVRAVLLLAGFEVIDGGADVLAKVVHHAVEKAKVLASGAEAKLVNAVGRRMGEFLLGEKEPEGLVGAKELGAYYSHPEWLVERWLPQFGAKGTRSLLEWNQSAAPVYARWRVEGGPVGDDAGLFEATKWEGFWRVVGGNWKRVEELVNEGAIFLQDPGTRLAVELLGVKGGETVLDACAAPGGKSLLMADILAKQGGGRVVSMDVPAEARVGRLKENLSRVRGADVALVMGDLRGARPLLKEHGLPVAYDAVLVDVPCSNTGVMRHRVDVKWRLQAGDFKKHAKQQGDLLSSAGYVTAPGGRLVYSTCSIDAEENEGVIKAFLERTKGKYKLEGQVQAFPWIEGHDGAAAFLLRKGM